MENFSARNISQIFWMLLLNPLFCMAKGTKWTAVLPHFGQFDVEEASTLCDLDFPCYMVTLPK